EDGIRDIGVTVRRVLFRSRSEKRWPRSSRLRGWTFGRAVPAEPLVEELVEGRQEQHGQERRRDETPDDDDRKRPLRVGANGVRRSEERREGKEWRSRWEHD